MAKRYAISISRQAYEALRAKCAIDTTSMASIVERYIREICGLPPPIEHGSGETMRMQPEETDRRGRVQIHVCGLCDEAGHNARTCTKRISPPRPPHDTSDDSAARFLASFEKRNPSPLPSRRPKHCSVCGDVGHTAQSCAWKAPEPTRPTVVVSPSNTQIAARLEKQRESAFDNPCRDPKCRIVSLHLAHEGEQ